MTIFLLWFIHKCNSFMYQIKGLGKLLPYIETRCQQRNGFSKKKYITIQSTVIQWEYKAKSVIFSVPD